jgi:hypothetical protein
MLASGRANHTPLPYLTRSVASTKKIPGGGTSQHGGEEFNDEHIATAVDEDACALADA